MLELYRLAQDEGADRLEDALQELAAAHRVIICTDSGALGPGLTLPAFKDEGRIIHGAAALKQHLEETARTLERWRRFQSDACYIGDNGNKC